MVDHHYVEPKLAVLYDTMCYGRIEFPKFYVPLVMSARNVLDVGTGTGELLRIVREAGHTGRLVGVDPAEAMLEVGRQDRSDVEWMVGTAESLRFDSEFDLAVMTGNAFMGLVEDEQIRAALNAVYAALEPGGRFAFETRNPAARQWEQWGGLGTVEHGGQVVSVEDRDVRVEGDLLKFSLVFSNDEWPQPEISYSTLRLLEVGKLNEFLVEAGFVIDEQYGDWDGEPVRESSLEIVTITRRP